VIESGGAVDVPLVVHGQVGGVVPGDVADVHVSRAVGDVDDGVIGERVARVGEIEHATRPDRAFLDRGVVQVASRCARLGGEAGAAVLEVEHDLFPAHLADPEAEPRAVGALAVASRHDLLPRGGVGGLIRRGGVVDDGLAGLLGLVPLLVVARQWDTDHHEAVPHDLRVG
jgi:hypothetical protein